MEKNSFTFVYNPDAVRKLEREAQKMRAEFIKDCFRSAWRAVASLFAARTAGRTA